MKPDLESHLYLLYKTIDSHLSLVNPSFTDHRQRNKKAIRLKSCSQSAPDSYLSLAKTCLNEVTKDLLCYPSDLHQIANYLSLISDYLPWYKISRAHASNDFHAGHLNAIVFGTNGLASYGNFVLGVTVMLSDLTYPTHRHSPSELYIALTAGEWWQPDLGWHRPGTGNTVENPGNTLHSMRSGTTHHVSLWVLHGDRKFTPGVA